MQMRAYDKSREETIRTKVVDVREINRGPMVVVVLAVKIEGQDAEIPLGSKDYLKENGMTFSKGDEITIKGLKDSHQLRMAPGGSEGIMEIGRDDKTAVVPEKPGSEVRTLRKEAAPEPGKLGSEVRALQKEATPESGKPGKEIRPLQKETVEGATAPMGRRLDGAPSSAPRIRAREVTKGGKTLTLLHDDGRPAWRSGPPAVAGGQAMPESPGKPGKPEKSEK
jgi:hypothetical protein